MGSGQRRISGRLHQSRCSVGCTTCTSGELHSCSHDFGTSRADALACPVCFARSRHPSRFYFQARCAVCLRSIDIHSCTSNAKNMFGRNIWKVQVRSSFLETGNPDNRHFKENPPQLSRTGGVQCIIHSTISRLSSQAEGHRRSAGQSV